MDEANKDNFSEKEPLLPFDKNATIRHLVSDGAVDEDDKEWDDDDSEYVMSEVEYQEVGEEAAADDFDVITEPEEDDDDDGSGAEMVIENPFEDVEPASPSGVKLEAVSLDNIIPTGRRRNQQLF